MGGGSKPLEHGDSSAFEFVKELLAGDETYAINFDRIQWDSKLKQYVIVEFLLCDEKQFKRKITPITSHPNKYFHINSMKFISLWKLTQLIGAKLFLVNYSKKGTKYEDEILLMEVEYIDENKSPPVKTLDFAFGSRQAFSEWFRKLNKRGRT